LKEYDPFYKFDINSWVPFKLIAENDNQVDHYDLIPDYLDNNGLVVITGLFGEKIVYIDNKRLCYR
jgi:hypothetical protein